MKKNFILSYVEMEYEKLMIREVNENLPKETVNAYLKTYLEILIREFEKIENKNIEK